MFYKKDDDYIRSLEKLVVIITYQNIFIIYCISLLSYHRGINAHIGLAIYFWFFTRKHVQTLRNREFIRHFDKQITRMGSLPFAAITLYRSLTSQMVRSPDQENIVQFFRFLAIGLFYVQYCTDYYLYLITSSEMRERTKKILFFWHHHSDMPVVTVQLHAITMYRLLDRVDTNNYITTRF